MAEGLREMRIYIVMAGKVLINKFVFQMNLVEEWSNDSVTYYLLTLHVSHESLRLPNV